MSQDNPFEGWALDSGDPFEDNNGPIYHTRDTDGRYRCGFRVEPRHCNGAGIVHGGMLMLFADFALFAIARDRLQGMAVTVSMNSDFTAPAYPGDIVLADGEVIHESGRMLFVRGRIYTEASTLMGFTGIIRRVGKTARN